MLSKRGGYPVLEGQTPYAATEHWRNSKHKSLQRQSSTKTGCDASSALYLCDCQMYNRRNEGLFCWSGRAWHIVVASVGVRRQTISGGAVGWDQDTADLDTPDRKM